MSTIVYVSPTLPWDPLPGESNRLRLLMAFMLLLALIIMIVVPLVHIPEIKRAEAEAVPERLAKMVVQQKEIPPPPAKPAEKAKPEEVVIKPETKPDQAEAAPKPVVTELQKSAAKARASKAIQEAGIDDALADLRSMDVITLATPKGLPGQVGNGTGGLITGTEEAGTSRNLLTSRAGAGSGAGSGNAYAGGVSSGFGGGKAGGKGSAGMMGAGVTSGGGKLQSVQSGLQSAANVNARAGKDGKARRTGEDIRKTFDQYGGRLNNLYQRALRDNPTMQGTVSLKLTIAPDGSVRSCAIASSQLENPELEGKIVAIVKGFNFGADTVEIWSGTHAINFFPN